MRFSSAKKDDHKKPGRFIDTFASSKILLTVGILAPAFVCLFFFVFSNTSIQPIEVASPRLVILGLDGATWSVIDPLIKQNKLPHIAEMKHQGASGNLYSLDPMRSPALWTSIATGVSPDKHGVSGFFSTRADVKRPRIWDVAQRAGFKVGLFRWMATWPIMDRFDFIVPSWIARTNDVWPSDDECLQSILLHSPPDALGQFRALTACVRRGARLRSFDQMVGVTLRSMWREDELSELADRALNDVRLQTDIYIAMLERHQPDASAFVLYGSDQLGHRFWRFHEPNAFTNSDVKFDPHFSHVIEDYYIAADRAFGRILKRIDKNCRIILVSDHGMKADSALPGQYFIHADALLRILGFVDKVDHQFIERRWLISAKPGVPSSLTELSQALAEIRFSKGDEVFEASEESGQLVVRTQFSMTANPQSPIERFREISIAGKKYPISDIFFVRYFSGEHDPKGIFLMNGPGVKQGQWIEHASLLDVAPTAMYWMGLPLSREIEGSVIDAAFKEEYLNQNGPAWVDAYGPLDAEETLVPDASADMLERLRSLGYVE